MNKIDYTALQEVSEAIKTLLYHDIIDLKLSKNLLERSMAKADFSDIGKFRKKLFLKPDNLIDEENHGGTINRETNIQK